MTSPFMKHRTPIAIGCLAVLALIAALRKESDPNSFRSSEGRKRLSDFQIAEAQSGTPNTLQEHEFADSKAQEAFSGTPSAHQDTGPAQAAHEAPADPAASEGSARDRAAALLGPPPANPEPAPTVAPRPTAAPRDAERNQRPAPARKESAVTLAADTRPLPAPAPSMPAHGFSGSGVYAKNPPPVMAYLDDEEVTETLGSRSTYVRGDLLKMGSIYLAKIPDAIDVRGSRKQTLNINVIGKMTQHTLSQPFVLVGEASLAEDGRSIFIEVKNCIAPEANARAIACSGDVKGLDGTDGLKNEIYSPQIWPSILSILGTAGEIYALGRMTQSVTEAGVLMDQTQSNALWSAAGAAWKKSFDLSAERLERDRIGGRASGGAIVKVHITKDTSLW